jgi:hypothetical protein
MKRAWESNIRICSWLVLGLEVQPFFIFGSSIILHQPVEKKYFWLSSPNMWN